MPTRKSSDATHLELIPAPPDQQPILANLLELYLHDFSEFHHLRVDPNGRFGYPNLPLYWSDPDRHAFLIKINNKLAGFALIKKVPHASTGQSPWDMAEFFILRRYRRSGMGTRAAHEVWNRFPGPWQVRVMHSNTSALHFWKHAIRKFTGRRANSDFIENEGQTWHIFTFESRLA